jgi:chromosome segregation protein
MTRVTKLVLEGFKSFARRTEFLFDDKFNVILGPNGSGKSNVLDAFCFVLGRTSAKSMRAEKSANLIYNGGKIKNPASKAEVSIFFDNSDKTFPSEAKEVKITRLVKSSGQGIYKINDKRVTRGEIIELLSAAKIDPEGYNIVLQGDINDFVEMSPVQRRMLVEEIAGISIYEDKKQKALSELQKVGERIKEAEIILSEKETSLSELKKDREQALKYKELKDKIDENKGSYLDIQIKKKKKEVEKGEQKTAELAKEIEETAKEITALRAQIEEKKKLIEKIRKEINEKAETDELALNKEVEELKIGIATLSTRAENHKKELAKTEGKISSAKKEIEENNSRIKDLSAQSESLKSKKAENGKQIGKIDSSISEFRKKHNLDDVTEIEKEIEKIDAESEKASSEIQKLNEERQSLLRDKDRLEIQISTIEQQITKVAEIEKEHKEEIESLKSKKSDFKETILNLNRFLSEASSVSARLADARAHSEQVAQALQRTRVRSAIARETSQGDTAVRRITEQKGKMQGIFGTVAELGKSPGKFSLALEVAAANRIKSIVVENEDNAAQCIKYLRENKFGVATFIPLSKIKAPAIDEETEKLATANGVFGFAYKLVEYETTFKKVFQYVFGDTLVIEDTAVAKRIGVGRARMVTLEGDLFERSGLITGGFRQKESRGGFAEKESIEELAKLEKESLSSESLITKFEGEKKAIEDKISELREKKATLEGDIIKTERGLHLESSDLEVSKRNKELAKEDAKKTDVRIKEKESALASAGKKLIEIKGKKQELRLKISGLRDPVLLAELTAFDQKKTALKEENNQADISLGTLSSQIEMITSDIDKSSKMIKQTEKEKAEFSSEIKKMETDSKSKSDALKTKEELQKSFKIKFKKLYSEQQTLSEEISKAEAEITIKDDKNRNTETHINNLALKKATATGELAGLEKEFEPFKNIVLIKNKSESDLRYEFEKYERIIQDMGAINLKALDVYDAAERQYNELLEKKAKLSEEKDSVLLMMQEIESKKAGLFMKTYDALDSNFKKFFSALTVKGEAFLELENKEEPFADDSGVLVKVKITQDKFLDIRSLSGGEKTLTALAFIFAIQEFEPASFYILDEVDAALDKRNSEKLAKLIKKYSGTAQYIVISHNDSIISEGDVLYGISIEPERAMSMAVSMKFPEARALVAEENKEAAAKN